MGINVRLFIEDRLTRDVVKKMLQQAERDYFILKPSFWNKNQIQKNMPELNRSAKEPNSLYLVVTDQDTLRNCPAGAVENLGAPLSPNLLYRFAVMEIEAWIMADRDNFADYLSVDIRSVPQLPDEVPKPKEKIVAIARKSRSRNFRDGLVPRHSKAVARVGPSYNDILSDFVMEQWNVDNAQKHSPSLKRTYQRLQAFQLSGS